MYCLHVLEFRQTLYYTIPGSEALGDSKPAPMQMIQKKLLLIAPIRNGKNSVENSGIRIVIRISAKKRTASC